MAARLQLLLVDSSASDAQLVVEELERGGYEVVWERVETAAAFVAAVRRQPWDVITCDPFIPQLSAPAVLRVLEEQRVSTPVVIVSRRNEDAGIAAMKDGARDFIDKRALGRLCSVMERELRDAELRRERERAEQELRLAGEIIAQLSDGIYLIRVADGVIVFTNPRFDAMFGYAPGELIGKNVSIVNAPTDKSPEETAREIQGTLVRYGRWEGEILNRKKDCTTFWCRASVSTFDHPQFGPVWVSVHRDVSDRKRAQEQARAHQAELAHVLRVHTMGEMATELAHEINQPLSSIANYAQGCRVLISSGTVPPSELLRPIEEIIAQTLRAGAIIRRLRTLVRRGTTIHEPVNFNDLVIDAVNAIAHKASQSSIPVNLELAPRFPRIEVDRIQIEQVILNLLLNGIEAMSASNSAQPELRVRTSLTAEGTIELTVSDRGGGVPAAAADEIFEPFVTNKPGGLGMGLPISRSIVERHGGKLWVTDNPSGGAIFHMALPLRQTEKREPEPS